MSDHATLVLLLAKLEGLVIARAQDLVERVQRGDESAWLDLMTAATTLKALLGQREPLLTTAELATKLNVSPRTIRALGKQKRLPTFERLTLARRSASSIGGVPPSL
jgi:hypothetical protein